MAFISTSVYSQVLQQRVPVDLFIPTDRKEGPLRQPRAVMYFLPGICSSEKDFQNYTAVNKYAMENHVAMVYPCAPYSFYSDMDNGFKYYTYLTEELPKILAAIFNLPTKREKTFVAGLSMGGYGALRLAFSRPDIFGGCASLSGAVDMRGMVEYAKLAPLGAMPLYGVFGKELNMPMENDLFYLATQVSKLPKEEQPRIFYCCGKQDDSYEIYNQNQGFKKHIDTLPIADCKYMQWDGVHDYTFWDRGILHAMSYLLKNTYDKKKLKLWRCDD